MKITINTNRTLITLSLIICALGAKAQNALKAAKQNTGFHYLQANAHYGFINNNGDHYMDIPSTGPANRLVYQFLKKNQRLMQKGYIRHTAFNNFRFRISADFRGSLRDIEKSNRFQLRMQNIGTTIRTKWDRTSIFIGYGNVRFGNNPKIDPVTDFTANTTSSDLGFNQDLGVSFRTAISPKYDFMASVYTGGIFSQPIISKEINHMMKGENMVTEHEWRFMDLDYDGNWLVTTRVGTPLFRANEYGLIAMAGRVIERGGDGITSRSLGRIGADMVIKFGEHLKIDNQITAGFTNRESENNTNSTDYGLQTNLEYYVRGMFIFNVSNATVITNYDDSALGTATFGRWINSMSYVVSPHTRIRLHHFLNYRMDQANDWGITAQLVTGFGKR